jgi:hypothetical protein
MTVGFSVTSNMMLLEAGRPTVINRRYEGT